MTCWRVMGGRIEGRLTVRQLVAGGWERLRRGIEDRGSGSESPAVHCHPERSEGSC